MRNEGGWEGKRLLKKQNCFQKIVALKIKSCGKTGYKIATFKQTL